MIIIRVAKKVSFQGFKPNFRQCFNDSFFILDNTLYFWKYPEDEQKRKVPIENETIALHDCISETVALAPRDVTSRMNTFMLENRRRIQSGDREALNVVVVCTKYREVTITHTSIRNTSNFSHKEHTFFGNRHSEHSTGIKNTPSWHREHR